MAAPRLTSILLLPRSVNWYRACAVFVALVVCLGPAAIWAQGQPPADPLAPPTAEEIQERRKEAAASADLDEAAKKKVDQLYQQAATELAHAKNWAAKTKDIDQQAVDAPQSLANLQSTIANGRAPTGFTPPPDADLSKLEKLLGEAREALAAAQHRHDTAQAEPGRRVARQRELPQQLDQAAAELAQVEKELAAESTSPPLVAQAERTLALARRAALKDQIQSLQGEAAYLEATRELVPLARDAAAAQLAPLKKDVERLSRLVKSKRDDDITRRLKENRRESALAHPAVKSVLEANTELTEERQKLAERKEKLEKLLAENRALQEDWQTKIQRTKEKIDAVGLWVDIALELRDQRRKLPDPYTYRSKPRARQDDVREVQYRRLVLSDTSSDLADVDDEVQQTLEGVQWPLAEGEAQEVAFAAEEAYEAQRQEVRDLLGDYDDYYETLTELNAVQRQIAEQSQDYANFVDERILWIESTEPVHEETPARWRESLVRWTNAEGWKSIGRVAWGDVKKYPLVYLAVMAALLFWYRYHQRMRKRIGEIGRQVRSNPAVPLRRSFEAFFLTVMVSALWPGILFLLAWRLGAAASVAPSRAGAIAFDRALADGLYVAACTYLFLEVPRRFCRGNGIAEAHFLWPGGAVAHLRETLRSMIFVLAPAALVIGATESITGRARDDSLGRVVFALAMVIVGIFLWRLLRYRGRFVQAILSHTNSTWLIRSRHFLFIPAMTIALALAGCALAGYYHTALELTWRMGLTLALLFLLIVAHGLGLRWFVAARVRLARARMIRERAAEAAAAEAAAALAKAKAEPTESSEEGESDDAAVAAIPPPDDEHEIDSTTIKQQTARILTMLLIVIGLLGAWWIWIDMFPALGVLGRVAVGTTSLGRIALAVLVGGFALVALRNLAGLLELSVLQRLPLDAGARYAITTMCKYAICVAAVIVVTWLIGFDWSKVQWLVAAMLVGLGFGLQEIFANFVSGLIILLERPIRPGDWITVGKTDGRVMKINMRATTVRDWDRKELIVPNKAIVTGEVVNWSLTESTLRIVIRVGIAYGSDTELATEILYRVAAEHPKILEKPKPKIIFREFGESALIFEMRIFIPHLDFWPRVMHETHIAIDREFRAAGITIAFPQRDLHVKSFEGTLATRTTTNSQTHEQTEDRAEKS